MAFVMTLYACWILLLIYFLNSGLLIDWSILIIRFYYIYLKYYIFNMGQRVLETTRDRH